jgi:flagellar basal-body rod modification protein FlgD
MTTVQATGTDVRASVLAALNVNRDQAAEAKGGLENRFLTLLVTQLRNQDPLNPMDNAQMTTQLAQISTVDGIERLNATLQALMESSNDSEAVQAADLVGRGVLVPGSGLRMVEGKAVGGVELAEPADQVKVTVLDANGLALRTLNLGPQDAGTVSFRWDGKTDSGTQAVDGAYRIAVEALRGDAKVSATALELGVVSSVTRTSQGASLNLGTLGAFKLADIRQII